MVTVDRINTLSLVWCVGWTVVYAVTGELAVAAWAMTTAFWVLSCRRADRKVARLTSELRTADALNAEAKELMLRGQEIMHAQRAEIERMREAQARWN